MKRPTDEQIRDELSETDADVCEGINRYPAMSYAEGVQAALLWVLGSIDSPPYTGD